MLAREQVETGGICWRGHKGVTRRDPEQWYLRITAYADELLADVENLDWSEHILAMQGNWIGRSEGVEFEMAVAGHDASFTVYTTRPDTVCGMTFAVLAPEHPLVGEVATVERRAEVTSCCREAVGRNEVERLSAGRHSVKRTRWIALPALAPFAPHIAEELWERMGGEPSVHQQSWPTWDEPTAIVEMVTIAVQVNGRVRDRLTVAADALEDEIKARALKNEKVTRHRAGRTVTRIIVVPGRAVNIVTE